ncbi:hypothetical protein MHBO_004158 [Bonamia ostreae]|uniref:Uncharacterized protein n=1 Tax=Bonamia ostreae TaxID=126728 RepID=A0ABV2ASJ2_9EUKA
MDHLYWKHASYEAQMELTDCVKVTVTGNALLFNKHASISHFFNWIHVYYPEMFGGVAEAAPENSNL